MIKVVCVRTGTKYGMRYVLHLQRMLKRYMPCEYEMICLTDNLVDSNNAPGVKFIDISDFKLHGWFAKMLIFNRSIVGAGKILYIDLDMAIARDLSELVNLTTDFGICQNFTQLRQANEGNVTWPCKYGSCVMLIGENFNCQPIWETFWMKSWDWMCKAAQFGDQWIIEQVWPNATFLQDELPEGYFLHYKDFDDDPDRQAAILVFAGKTKPIDCQIPWIRDAWYCKDTDQC